MRQLRLGQVTGIFASLFLAVFLFYPLGVILVRSLGDAGVVRAVWQNSFYAQRLWFTTYQALLSTLLTVLLGLPGALLFARYDFRGKRLLKSAFTIPFVMPTVVVAIGFLALVGPRGVTGTNLQGTLSIILWAHVFYNYALVVRIVGAYLEAGGPGPAEAAQMLGASPWRVLWRVRLPLAMPAVLAAAILVFVFCFTSFGVIVILAPAARFATLEVEIYRLTVRLLELGGAAVLALAQLLVVGLFTWLYTRLQARLAVPVGGARTPSRPRGWVRLWLGLNLLLAALLILSPLVALTVQALWPAGMGFGLQNFRSLAETPHSIGFVGVGRAVYNSLRFALGGTLLALVVGFAFAYAVVRGGWRWLDNLSLLPLAASAVTLGFGYLLAFPGLQGTPWGLVLAYSLIAFPFVTRSLLPALRGMPAHLPEAARMLGAGPLGALRRVELPLVWPSFITAASFAFAVSIGEFGATLVLTRPEYATIPVAIFDRLGRPGAESYGAALALAVMLMILTGGAMLLLEHFGTSEI
ncbi:MAG TPA: iron ABC transporter permease [Trueperaceae bacterium]